MKRTRLVALAIVMAAAGVATWYTRPAYAQGSDQSRGIWIAPGDLRSRPMAGSAWTALLNDANRDPGRADMSDQDSKHDAYTLAAALVYARTGQMAYYVKARNGLLAVQGTENKSGSRWLAVGRNLGAYVIAADVLGLRAAGDRTGDGSRVEAWVRGWLTKSLPDNNGGAARRMRPFGGGSNAEAQEGFAYATVAAYLGDRVALQRAWDGFRTFACDPDAPDREHIDLRHGVASGWAYDDAQPCAVNPKGATKRVPSGRPGAGSTHRIDGAIINDMRRGGNYQWEPGFTQYPWTGMAGFVPAAVVLHRAGYPALTVADRAVLRSAEYLSFLSKAADPAWFDGSRGAEVVQLINHYYGTSLPIRAVRVGHTIGYTNWTHPTSSN